MKKQLLFFLLFFCFSGVIFSQVQEDFEGGIPTDWQLYQTEADDPGFVITTEQAHTGNQSIYHNYAYLETESDSDSWLVSNPQAITVGVSEFLSFWYRQGATGTFYNYSGVYISTGSGDPMANPDDFIELQEFDADFGYSDDEWTKFTNDLSAYEGETVYIAFKYVGNGSHVFYIDDFTLSITPTCIEPTDVAVNIVSSTSIDVSWTPGDTETTWNIIYGPEGFIPGDGTGTELTGITDNPYTITGLTEGENYDLYIQADCGGGDTSIYAEPASFHMPGVGEDCGNPIEITALPYNTEDDTTNYGDNYTGNGTVNCDTASYYLNGNDVVYAYTTTEDTSIDISISDLTGTYSGLFVYASCDDIGLECVASYGSGSSSDDFSIQDLTLTGGTTYYIVISTWAAPQTVGYTLDITENTCINMEADFSVISDCDVDPQFFVEVDITSLGDAIDLNLSDNQGSVDQTASDVGIYTFGPYPNGTPVEISVDNNQDANCFMTSDELTQAYCSEVTVDCSAGEPVNTVFCYDAYEMVEITYTSSDGTVLNLDLNSGTIYMYGGNFVVLDSDGTELYSGMGNDNDLSGLSFQSSGDSITIQYTAGFYACGEDYSEIDLTVACSDCVNPDAAYTVVDDCASGTDQFYIDVEVTDMGSATSLMISDNQSSTPQQATTLDTYTFGPYPIATGVAFTIENEDDGGCVINSDANGVDLLTQNYCPPENDECIGAFELTVNEDTGECIESTAAVLQGATPSGLEVSCLGSAENDVWFTFTATSENHALSISNIQGYDDFVPLVYHAVYEGDECGNLTLVYCQDTYDEPNSSYDSFTVGQTYWVRVYSNEVEGYEDTTFDICVSTPGAPISTDGDQYTVEELVIDVLIDSPCAQASNITYSTGTDFGDTNGIGYFDNNEGDFPFESGIILSSGDIAAAPGPEAGAQSNGTYDWPGDDDLTDLIQEIEGNTTSDSKNATIIEFDFIPYVDEISFDFLFASEEYGQFQCDFSDPFAFFLTDSEGNTTNLAVVPGTDTPIAVTTIRNAIYNPPFGDCTSQNEEYFDAYYGEPNGSPGLTAPTNFLGNTVAMTAYSEVTPGEQYHIKLAVSDRNDNSWDSAVFLKAGSFDIGNPDLGGDLTVIDGTAPCEGEEVILDSSLPDSQFDFIWFEGEATEENILQDEVGPTLTVTEPGHYFLYAFTNLGCPASADVVVEFYTNPEFEIGDDLSICEGDNVVLDATASNEAEFDAVHYSWEDENGNVVSTDATYTVVDGGTYTATVSGDYEDDEGNLLHTCEVTDTIVISSGAGFTLDLGGDQVFCGVDSYTLTANVMGEDPENLTFEWSDANGVIVGETSQSLTVSQSGTYTVIASFDDCSSAPESVELTFRPSPIIDFGGAEIEVCDLTSVMLDATPSNLNADDMHFTWTYNGTQILEGDGAVYATVNAEDHGYGTYEVIVSYINDSTCSSSKSVQVKEGGLLLSLSVNDEDMLYCIGETAIFTAELTDETSNEIDFVWYENGEVVPGETGSTLSVTVEELADYSVEASFSGCVATTSLSIGIYEGGCEIPKGISPGTTVGINDCLDLTFLNDRTGISSLKLYNRYGRLVFEKGNYNNDWCGQDKDGNDLVTGTYYYVLELKGNDEVFGNNKKGWIYVNRTAQ